MALYGFDSKPEMGDYCHSYISVTTYTRVVYWITEKPPRTTGSRRLIRKETDRKVNPMNIIHDFNIQSRFTMVPNQIVEDSRLSWGARGLALRILGVRQGVKISESTLLESAPSGRDALRTLIRELESFGYLKRTRQRRSDGTLGGSCYVMHLAPMTEYPTQVEPTQAEPLTPYNTISYINTNLPPIVPHSNEVACVTEPLRTDALADHDELGTESLIKPEPSTRQNIEKINPITQTLNTNAAQQPQDAPVSDFDAFWALAPRRVGKRAAERAWRAVERRGESLEAIDGMRAYAQAYAQSGVDLKYIPHPSTWLNRRGWEDDLSAVFPSQGPQMTEWEQKATQMGYDLSGLKNTPQITAQRRAMNQEAITQWN